MRKSRILPSKKLKCGGDAHGDKHHATHRPSSKDQQVNHCPARVSNGGEDEERNRGRTSESVNNPDHQRTQLLIETDLAEQTIKPGEWSLMAVRTRFRRV